MDVQEVKEKVQKYLKENEKGSFDITVSNSGKVTLIPNSYIESFGDDESTHFDQLEKLEGKVNNLDVEKAEEKPVHVHARKPKFKEGDTVYYKPKLSGFDSTKPLIVSNVRYKENDELAESLGVKVKPHYVYSFEGSDLGAVESDLSKTKKKNPVGSITKEEYQKLLLDYNRLTGIYEDFEDEPNEEERIKLKKEIEEIESKIHRFERKYGKGGEVGERIILKSPALASDNDDNDYRFVLVVKEPKLDSNLRIERNFKKKGEWDGVPSGWYIGTLLDKEGYHGTGQQSDFIYIDGGQKWGVGGLQDALKEVKEILNIKDDADKKVYGVELRKTEDSWSEQIADNLTKAEAEKFKQDYIDSGKPYYEIKVDIPLPFERGGEVGDVEFESDNYGNSARIVYKGERYLAEWGRAINPVKDLTIITDKSWHIVSGQLFDTIYNKLLKAHKDYVESKKDQLEKVFADGGSIRNKIETTFLENTDVIGVGTKNKEDHKDFYKKGEGIIGELLIENENNFIIKSNNGITYFVKKSDITYKFISNENPIEEVSEFADGGSIGSKSGWFKGYLSFLNW